ncbi:hypothetical protein HZS_7548 [Henneguya salminicola]|nr:hypothetical protein HZS_7548 [Henneguya salminicola]
MLIWCTNEALSLMRYNSHMFVDCTFRSAPAPFNQCLIIMVHDAGTEMFVPCVYSLITLKSESIYLNAIERKLKKYKVSDHNCHIILSNIELLKVVPIEEITTVLRYISTLTVLQPELASFWSYFHLTWRRRTINALERYSRRIGENFANAHPNLASFISIIRTEFLYYSERCA